MPSPSDSFALAQPVERFRLTSAAVTDVGAMREVNEDAFTIDETIGLYLVCDGMGGHAFGQLASTMAVQAIADSLRSGEPAPQEGEDPLATAIQYANAEIHIHANNNPECHGMGTTAVGFRLHDDFLHVCHVGDSRAYQLRGGQLTQITRDHSLVNLYEDYPDLASTMGPATSNVIIRAIGLLPELEVEERTVALEDGDIYLLCCDGLTDLVEDWMIREMMTSGDPLAEIAENLVRSANANGGSDNITVVLVQAKLEADGTGSIPSESPTHPGY